MSHADHLNSDTGKPAPWPQERTLSLVPRAEAMQTYAAAVNFEAPTCGHTSAFTATRLAPGAEAAEVLCDACFSQQRDADAAVRSAQLPVLAGAECLFCGSSGPCKDYQHMGAAMCESCCKASIANLRAIEAKQVPKSEVPDEVLRGLLYIGAKESQTSAATLASKGITRVLICCDFLPAYHAPGQASGLRYHRLAVQDSLAQNIRAFLPSALAFIAQGALAGQRTLVHCNAGVSRSGTVLVECLRQFVGLSIADAWAAAMGGRPRVNPNTNFLRQLGFFEEQAALAQAAEAGSGAGSGAAGGAAAASSNP